MVKLQFKKKCRYCKAVWVIAVHREPTICDACKRKAKRNEKNRGKD